MTAASSTWDGLWVDPSALRQRPQARWTPDQPVSFAQTSAAAASVAETATTSTQTVTRSNPEPAIRAPSGAPPRLDHREHRRLLGRRERVGAGLERRPRRAVGAAAVWGVAAGRD